MYVFPINTIYKINVYNVLLGWNVDGRLLIAHEAGRVLILHQLFKPSCSRLCLKGQITNAIFPPE